MYSISIVIIMKLIGTSKMTQNKISLIQPIANKLDMQPGDVLAFLESSTGDIIIKNRSDIEMKDTEDKI